MKKMLIGLLLLAGIGGGVGYYMWNKPPESMATRKSDMGLTANDLCAAFLKDETAANSQYLGKIIVITGTVKESRSVDGVHKLSLETATPDVFVNCELDNQTQHPRTAFNAGEQVKIKGEVAGAELDGSVQLSHCAEEK
jgi:hypothetical protein